MDDLEHQQFAALLSSWKDQVNGLRAQQNLDLSHGHWTSAAQCKHTESFLQKCVDELAELVEKREK